MRIAIVEDTEPELLELKQRLSSILTRRGWEWTISEFKDGGTFLAAARKKFFDLIFLDIYMEGIDGVETARRLRAFDADCVLVFTTTSPDHALDGYRVRALQYLVKPYAAAEIERLFDELEKRMAPEKYIELKASRQDVKLRLNDILWADHFQHQVHIHMTDGSEVASRINFTEFCTLLADDTRFFVCRRGVVVNLSHADDFTGLDFILDNGTMIPVSRALAPAARETFGEYLFAQGGRVKA